MTTPPSALSEDGFLSTIRADVWTQFEARCPLALVLAQDFNRLAIRISARRVNLPRKADLFALALYFRCIQNFEGCIVLCASGMRAESRCLARATLETAIHCSAACRDLQYPDGGSYLERLAGGHENFRKRVMDELDKMGELTDGVRAAWQQKLPEILENIDGIVELNLRSLMRDLGLEPLYTVLYRPLCQDAHPTVQSAELHVVVDDEQQFRGVRLNIDFKSADETVAAAACSLLIATDAYVERFSLTEFHSEVRTIHEMYWELCEKMNDEAAIEFDAISNPTIGGRS